jgi:hypothetical protein
MQRGSIQVQLLTDITSLTHFQTQYAVSSDIFFCVYLLTPPGAGLFSGLNPARAAGYRIAIKSRESV